MRDGPLLPGAGVQIGSLRYHHFYLTEFIQTLIRLFYTGNAIRDSTHKRKVTEHNFDENCKIFLIDKEFY